jgi:hypothetical protein
MKNSTTRVSNHWSPAWCACVALLLILATTRWVVSADLAATRQIVNPFALSDNTLRLLEENKQKQIQAARTWRAFHDFQFTDRYEESGIRFQHQPVDDAAKTYKAVHYDHGTGVAVADVDGDGHLDVYFVNQLGATSFTGI